MGQINESWKRGNDRWAGKSQLEQGLVMNEHLTHVNLKLSHHMCQNAKMHIIWLALCFFVRLVCFLFRRTSSWVASRKRSPRRKRWSGTGNEDGSQRNRCKPLWDGARRFLGCFQFWCQNLRCNKMVRVSPNPTRLDVYVLLSSLILHATSQLSGRTSSALWRFAKSLVMKGFGRSFLH